MFSGGRLEPISLEGLGQRMKREVLAVSLNEGEATQGSHRSVQLKGATDPPTLDEFRCALKYSSRDTDGIEEAQQIEDVNVAGAVAFSGGVTLEPDVHEGDEVVLLGRQGDEEIDADEWADRLDSVSWEVLCGFGPRLPRRYRG